MNDIPPSPFRFNGNVIYHDEQAIATFPAIIKKILCHDKNVIVLLDMIHDHTVSTDDELYSRNLFCLSADGSVLWALPNEKIGRLFSACYQTMSGIFNGHFFTTSNTNGYRYTVDANTGALLDPVYEK